jgi:hypothetical protein
MINSRALRPFTIAIPQADLDDLHVRLAHPHRLVGRPRPAPTRLSAPEPPHMALDPSPPMMVSANAGLRSVTSDGIWLLGAALRSRRETLRSGHPKTPGSVFDLPGTGIDEFHRDVPSVTGEFVTYWHHFRLADDVIITSSTVRFMTQSEVARILAAAGFADIASYGNWDRSPAGPEAPELIVVARTGLA